MNRPLTYYHSGGDILSATGERLSFDDAFGIMSMHALEGARTRRLSVAEMHQTFARDLARAIVEHDRWRLAARAFLRATPEPQPED